MHEFKDKVAVITGAASGIGHALATHCVQEGMKVVLADVEGPALLKTEKELQALNATILPIQMDVSKAQEVEMLAEKALDAFGAVHVLFNNAGVAAGGSIWESTLADWEWVLGVNLWGVIHGLRVFVPLMLAQDTEAHIVNTASIAGLVSYHPSASYQVTKHAVVALSEQLHHSLLQRNARVKTSVLCPGWVNTQILDAGRNRPPERANAAKGEQIRPELETIFQSWHQAVQTGMSPLQVADHVFKAIREETFYIFTDPDWMPAVQRRMQDILQADNPTLNYDGVRFRPLS
jgi:NADP-dependent 3-hydroxy acid dehydrogenase YdfG